ncbi:hypothetical protein EVAR_53354_1 [Eumeta japonica]|uniref:Uncharacterized protein n=1 Tax=Eumeta variegata TaxID=151549 RepID=A0A4C1YGP5_EUMVA|nr:hypothetical protein EVAR_53354_1 [Eumeta japonica]
MHAAAHLEKITKSQEFFHQSRNSIQLSRDVSYHIIRILERVARRPITELRFRSECDGQKRPRGRTPRGRRALQKSLARRRVRASSARINALV